MRQFDRIQRAIPRQLKAIFGLQDQADELAFGKWIQPVWNVEPLIGGRGDYTWVEGSLLVGFGALGQITFTVPADEEWHVKQISGAKPTTTGNTRGGQIGMRPAGTTLAATLNFAFERAAELMDSTIPIAWGHYFETPAVLSAGDQVVVTWFNGEAATNRTFTAGVLRRILALTGAI